MNSLDGWGYKDFMQGHFSDEEKRGYDLLFGGSKCIGVDFGVGLGFGQSLTLRFSDNFSHEF